jgi:cell shape-determining protein MreD
LRRRIAPYILLFVAAMLDTTVVPMFLQGPYAVPLTWIIVMCLALLTGSMHGMLYGLFGGLLMDVTSGTLGERLIPLTVIGFLLGLIVYESDPRRLREISRRKLLLRRLIYSVAFSLAAEAVILFIQYFHTARFEWVYLLNCAIRAGILGLATLTLLPYIGRVVLGKNRKKEKKAPAQEVKSF